MPDENVRIELQPLGEVFEVRRGTPLQDVLFAHGVEFPCGGRGRCKKCRIKVLSGSLPGTPEQEAILTAQELAAGWRLACRCRAEDDLTLEIAQWEAAILVDESAFAFTPSAGLGVAVDLGTTTLVAQLLDLRTGHVLAVRTGLNPQATYGSDIMSRVQFAMTPGGRKKLEELIRKEIGDLIDELLASVQSDHAGLSKVVIVGNTVMHHLFCGLDVEPLSHYPFESRQNDLQVFRAGELDWRLDVDTAVCFLPNLGSFVGSDILAGVLATRLHESDSLVAFVDLGTNGEIVLGNGRQMLCASTAAGPAFEGARISMGMRAATGAISQVTVERGGLKCHVLGNVPARGICGSGLVDAVAAGLELGLIEANGRLANNYKFLSLCSDIKLTQGDVRELQLAKGAIAAGIRILLEQWGTSKNDVTKLYLAGAFGNYINLTSAQRIGLLDFPQEIIEPAGNTALLGAKLALFAGNGEYGHYRQIRSRMKHVSLSVDPHFQDVYTQAMMFPQA